MSGMPTRVDLLPPAYRGDTLVRVIPLAVPGAQQAVPAGTLVPFTVGATPATAEQITAFAARFTTLRLQARYRERDLPLAMSLSSEGGELSFEPSLGIVIEAPALKTRLLRDDAVYDLECIAPRPGDPLGDFVYTLCGGELPVRLDVTR